MTLGHLFLHNRRMLFEGLLAIIIFSLVPLAIKFTIASPLTICLFRLIVAVIALALIWRKKINFKNFFFTYPENWKLWLIGVVFFFHWVTYAYGVKLGGPSIGVLGLSTYGIQLVIGGAIFLGQRVTRKDIFCLVFSLIGILMIIPSWNFKDNSTQGIVLALLSATCFAILPILHQKSQNFSLETRIFAQFFGALVGFMLFSGKTNWDLRPLDWWALIFLGVFGTLIAHSMWARVSAKVSSAKAGLAYYMITPLSILLSSLLLGENFTQLQMAGALVVILAAILNTISLKS